MPSILESLKHIEDETESYKTLIKNKQWDQLSSLTVKRQQKLESIFNQDIDKSLVDEVKNSIERILKLDQAYAQEVKNQKKGESSNIIDIKSKFKAAKQYKSIHEST